MKEKPLVSIIIPVYNGADYMCEAIDSALNQTYKNIEVIVINDGSTDETDCKAKLYGDRIRYLSKTNGGVSTALNAGIKVMRGKYFSWLSHDDIYQCNKIEEQVRLLERYDYKNTLIALCNNNFIDTNSSNISNLKETQRFADNQYVTWNEALLNLVQHGSFNGCSLLIPAETLRKCGFFDEKLRYAQDVLMWMNLLLDKNDIIYSSKQLVSNRVHEKQLTQKNSALFHKENYNLYEMCFKRIVAISSKEYNYAYAYLLHDAIMDNPQIVKSGMSVAKEYLSSCQRAKLRVAMLYGYIRPVIRKVYYFIFRRIKTK